MKDEVSLTVLTYRVRACMGSPPNQPRCAYFRAGYYCAANNGNRIPLRDPEADCPRRMWGESIHDNRSRFQKLLDGASGIGKAVLHLDVCPPAALAVRQKVCTECTIRYRAAGTDWCGVCGCALAAKLRIASERCPLEQPKWGPVAPVK